MENWKNQILNSLEGLERANPPADVLQKIQQKIKEQNEANKRQWLAVAAAVIIVACANILLITNYDANHSYEEPQKDYSELVSDYSLY